MLQILATLATQLDKLGHRAQASRLDQLLLKLAADDEPSKDELAQLIKFWNGQRQQPRPIDTQELPLDQFTRTDYEVAARHQLEQDKQDLLQDLATQVEQELGERVKAKLDKSYKILGPFVALGLDGGRIVISLREAGNKYLLSAEIKQSDNTDNLVFPIDPVKAPAGPIWVETVARQVAGKILQHETKTTNS